MEDVRVVDRDEKRDAAETIDERPVSRAEFVGLMVALAIYDRGRYEVLCERGRSEAIPSQSDYPN